MTEENNEITKLVLSMGGWNRARVREVPVSEINSSIGGIILIAFYMNIFNEN